MKKKFEFLCGQALEKLQELEDESVHCVVTSPPYWGLRDYGVDDQLGLEQTPDEYVENMVAVFREVWRVLRDDGTLWLNLGDSYAGSNTTGGNDTERKWKSAVGSRLEAQQIKRDSGLKAKDLVGIPWRVAFALQADGWYLRQDIIWHKPNPMPESVTDRCTKAHEYVFLLTKSARYFYDADAVKERLACPNETRRPLGSKGAWEIDGRKQRENGGGSSYDGYPTKRNKRSVWAVSIKPYKEAHFAVYPPELIKPCILAGTSSKGCCPKCGAPFKRIVERTPMVKELSDRKENLGSKGQTCCSGKQVKPPTSKTVGWEQTCDCVIDKPISCTVLDPFIGSGTTAEVSLKLHRSCIGIDLNPENENLIQKRIEPYINTLDLFKE